MPKRLRAALNALEPAVLLAHGHPHYVGFLLPDERRRLKMADILEGLLRCAHEARLGNRYASIVAGRYESYLRELRPFAKHERIVQAAVRAITKGAFRKG